MSSNLILIDENIKRLFCKNDLDYEKVKIIDIRDRYTTKLDYFDDFSKSLFKDIIENPEEENNHLGHIKQPLLVFQSNLSFTQILAVNIDYEYPIYNADGCSYEYLFTKILYKDLYLNKMNEFLSALYHDHKNDKKNMDFESMFSNSKLQREPGVRYRFHRIYQPYTI